MGTAAALFLASALAIIIAGSLLTRFADRIAERTGLGRMLAGSILLAAATSLPEIMVDINALKLGQPDLAVGDLFGSSLFNLLILMGVSLYFPWGDTGFDRASPQHNVAAALGIVLTSVIGMGLVSRLEWGMLGAGFFPWIALTCYVMGMCVLFKERKQSQESRKFTMSGLGRPVAGFIACTAVIMISAPFLVESADRLAQETGLGHSFIGTTLVALSTSLPELVSTVAAFRIGQPNLAAGNIFGSNMFNMVMFLPLDWVFPGNLLHASSEHNLVTVMGVIFCASTAVVTLLHPPSGRKSLIAGNGLVVASVLGVLFLLYHSQHAA